MSWVRKHTKSSRGRARKPRDLVKHCDTDALYTAAPSLLLRVARLASVPNRNPFVANTIGSFSLHRSKKSRFPRRISLKMVHFHCLRLATLRIGACIFHCRLVAVRRACGAAEPPLARRRCAFSRCIQRLRALFDAIPFIASPRVTLCVPRHNWLSTARGHLLPGSERAASIRVCAAASLVQKISRVSHGPTRTCCCISASRWWRR